MSNELITVLLVIIILSSTLSIPEVVSSSNNGVIINLTYQSRVATNMYDPYVGREAYIEVKATISTTMRIYNEKLYESISVQSGKMIIVSSGKTYTYPLTDTGVAETYTRDLDEYFNSYFTTIMQNISSNTVIQSIEYYIIFEGYGTYEDYQVYMFKLENIYIEMSTGDKVFRGHGNGELYLDQSFLIPVKFTISITLTGRLQGSLTYTFKLEEASNLPKDPPASVVKTSKAYILCGGLPGSKIIITGSKNDNELKIKNTGDKPGYVIIIDKRTQLASYNITNNAYGPLNKVKVISIKPGEEKTIILWFTLDEDISVSTTNGSNTFDITYLLIITVFIVIVGVLVYVIRRTIKKSLETGYMEETIGEPGSVEEEPEVF